MARKKSVILSAEDKKQLLSELRDQAKNLRQEVKLAKAGIVDLNKAHREATKQYNADVKEQQKAIKALEKELAAAQASMDKLKPAAKAKPSPVAA